MGALVLEGGTFRPIFSCGVMDALLDRDVHFPYVIGVSAGITNGVSYVSRQRKRACDILMHYRHDKRYIGFRNFFTDQSLFGLKFAYETIPSSYVPFDWDTYKNSGTTVRVGVTNAETGKIEYLDGMALDARCDMLKATCAIPFVFPVIEVQGKKYYDGGISDPVPVLKARADGHEKMLIVLTRTESYRKDLSLSNVAAAKVLEKKYPNLVNPLLTRHIRYNRTIRMCEQMEREGKAVILRPNEEVQVDSFEKDLKKMDRAYRYGYHLAMENMDRIQALLKD